MDHLNHPPRALEQPSPPPPVGRHRWQRLDLRCLQCGRALGSLLRPETDRRTSAGPLGSAAFFRSADPSVPICRLTGQQRLACAICGGRPLVDEVRSFSVYQEAQDDREEDEPPGRRRRGRPAKPWRRPAHWSAAAAELDIAG